MAALAPLTASALVALGGGVGAVLRYRIGLAISTLPGAEAFPWATLLANLSGSLAMGVLVGLLARDAEGEAWRLLLGVGLLGGFTTFSAFSLELVAFAQRGAYGTAAAYACASVAIGALALVAGLAISRTAA